jgi:hypothetical protein
MVVNATKIVMNNDDAEKKWNENEMILAKMKIQRVKMFTVYFRCLKFRF